MALVTVERATTVADASSEGDQTYDEQNPANYVNDNLSGSSNSLLNSQVYDSQNVKQAAAEQQSELSMQCDMDGRWHMSSASKNNESPGEVEVQPGTAASRTMSISMSASAPESIASHQTTVALGTTRGRPIHSRAGTGSSTKCSLSASARLIRESYVVVKGAAVILSRSGEHTPLCAANRPGPEIQGHLQAIISHVLKPCDTIRAAVRLESKMEDCIKYVAVVYRIGMTDLEESIVLGIDIISPPNTNIALEDGSVEQRPRARVGVVLPLFADAAVKLDGDGGFSVSSNERCHVFKPVSIQAMWSALHTIDRAAQIARRHLFHPTGLSHTWTTVYEAMLSENDELLVADWNRLDEVEPTLGVSITQQRLSAAGTSSPNQTAPTMSRVVQTAVAAASMEQSIRAKLKEIMLTVDLEEVNTKHLRERLETEMATSMSEYRALIDEEAIVVMGQLEKASEIFDYLFLGSEWNASNWDELHANGVTHILNVSREVDCFFPAAFQYLTVRVYDTADADLLIFWDRTFRFVDDARRAGGRVLVHCKMGISRSASTVIAFCMKERGWSLAEASRYVKMRRACIKPNDNFMRQLAVYAGIVEASRQRHNPLFKSDFDEPAASCTAENRDVRTQRCSQQLNAPIASQLARRRLENSCMLVDREPDELAHVADPAVCFNEPQATDTNAALMNAFKTDRPVIRTRSLNADLADSRSADSRPDDDADSDVDGDALRERERIDRAVRSFAHCPQSTTQAASTLQPDAHMDVDVDDTAPDVCRHRHLRPRASFGTYPLAAHRSLRNTILVLDPLRFTAASSVLAAASGTTNLAHSRTTSVSMSTGSSSLPSSPIEKECTLRSIDSQSDSDGSTPMSVVLRRSPSGRDSYCRYRTAETAGSTVGRPPALAPASTNSTSTLTVPSAVKTLLPGPDAMNPNAATYSCTSMEMNDESASTDAREVDIGVKMHYERENIPWQPGTVKRQSLCLEQRARLSVVTSACLGATNGTEMQPPTTPVMRQPPNVYATELGNTSPGQDADLERTQALASPSGMTHLQSSTLVVSLEVSCDSQAETGPTAKLRTNRGRVLIRSSDTPDQPATEQRPALRHGRLKSLGEVHVPHGWPSSCSRTRTRSLDCKAICLP